MNDLVKIQALLEDKADCQARLNLLPYDGSPEIKEQNGSRYLYVRKRIAGKLRQLMLMPIPMNCINYC